MRRKPVMMESVTPGPWGPAVNWVMRADRLLANMTQYRVAARNCEAKRLHIVASAEANVACDYAHVGAARQLQAARNEIAPTAAGGGVFSRLAAACPYKLGCRRRTMANCSFPHPSLRPRTKNL